MRPRKERLRIPACRITVRRRPLIGDDDSVFDERTLEFSVCGDDKVKSSEE
jgi:hypothetical protein